jgi:hypothetical protein
MCYNENWNHNKKWLEFETLPNETIAQWSPHSFIHSQHQTNHDEWTTHRQAVGPREEWGVERGGGGDR